MLLSAPQPFQKFFGLLIWRRNDRGDERQERDSLILAQLLRMVQLRELLVML